MSNKSWFSRIFGGHPVFGRATTVPLSLLSPDRWPHYLINTSKSGASVTPTTALTYSTLYACVDRISKIAALPINVYEATTDGKKIATYHDQYNLIKNSPSDRYTSVVFFRSLVTNYLLWGDGYAEIVRDMDGRPMEYKLKDPIDIEPYVGDDGRIYYHDRKEKRDYVSNDMIHISDLNMDGLKGKSKITLHRELIGTGKSANSFTAEFLDKGLFFGGHVETDKTLSSGASKMLGDSLYNQMNSKQTIPVLEEGMKFVERKMQMSLGDAQFLQSREFTKNDVAAIFGVPPELVGGESPKFNNGEQRMIDFVSNTLAPLAVVIEQELNRKIFRPSEVGRFYIKIELKGLLRGDIKSRTEFYKALWDRGVFSINDIRSLEDMNKIDGGDRRFTPLNMIPLDKIDDYIDSITETQANQEPRLNGFSKHIEQLL